MMERSYCPLCARRKPERFCPAKGEKICAVCCGEGREVTIDCPSDCTYLIAAHRYEQEHRPPLAESELPFPTVEFSKQLIYERQPVLAGLSRIILNSAAERHELADLDVLAAITALTETYRTLVSGIYYEKPPDSPLAGVLYAALEEFLRNYKQQESQKLAAAPLKDTEIFHLLVFLARVGRTRTNLRPRSRLFLEFLRAQFPSEETRPAEASRIIIP